MVRQTARKQIDHRTHGGDRSETGSACQSEHTRQGVPRGQADQRQCPVCVGGGFRVVTAGNTTPLHGRVVFAWEDAFGWTREETLWLCMGGSAPRREERMLQTVMFSVEDLFELARRK